MALYLQVLLTEVFTGRYDISFLRTTGPLPSMSPFKMPHAATSLRSDLSRIRESEATDHGLLRTSPPLDFRNGFQTYCDACSRSSFTAWSSVAPHVSIAWFCSLSSFGRGVSSFSTCPSSFGLRELNRGYSATEPEDTRTHEQIGECPCEGLTTLHVNLLQRRPFQFVRYRNEGKWQRGHIPLFALKGLFTTGPLTRSERKAFLETSRGKSLSKWYPWKFYMTLRHINLLMLEIIGFCISVPR